jgi:hypothetical protein
VVGIWSETIPTSFAATKAGINNKPTKPTTPPLKIALFTFFIVTINLLSSSFLILKTRHNHIMFIVLPGPLTCSGRPWQSNLFSIRVAEKTTSAPSFGCQSMPSADAGKVNI